MTQIWSPNDHKGLVHFDVMFFHGFQFGQDAQNMRKTTQLTLNHLEICWPQEWLGPKLGHNVRILLLSYDACATKSKSHGFGNTKNVSHIAKNLVQSMVTEFDLKPFFFATIFPIVCCKDCMDLGFHTHINELYSKITNYVLEIWVFQICCNSLPLYRNMPL